MLGARRNRSAINKKLASFERGFLSEAGIKDREWYRHLGVAPGKWKVCIREEARGLHRFTHDCRDTGRHHSPL